MTRLMRYAFVVALVSASYSLMAAEPLPAPWKHQDIKPSAALGAAEMVDGAIAVSGTMDIWGTADGSHLAYQPIHGDVELIARVATFDNPGAVNHAKAAICIRESVAPGARHVSLCITACDGTQFIYRKEADKKAIHLVTTPEQKKTLVPKATFPCWLKLVRHGNSFTGYESLDGKTWMVSGQIEVDMPAEAVAGLAASSHKPDVVTKATFDHISVTAGSTK